MEIKYKNLPTDEPMAKVSDEPKGDLKLQNRDMMKAAVAVAALQLSESKVAGTAQEEIDAFKKVTYLLIGAILTQHGRKAIQLTKRELRKFEEGDKEVICIPTAGGGLRYEIQKKRKVN